MDAVERAREKMERKSLDMMIFNDISRTDIGFDSDFNEVRILTRDSEVLVEKAPKETIAELISGQHRSGGALAAAGGPATGLEVYGPGRVTP